MNIAASVFGVNRVAPFAPRNLSCIMTPEHERWAEAVAIQQRYGDQANAHIAEQVATLAIAGDQAGVPRWREVAARLDQLQTGTMQ